VITNRLKSNQAHNTFTEIVEELTSS